MEVNTYAAPANARSTVKAENTSIIFAIFDTRNEVVRKKGVLNLQILINLYTL